VKAADAPALKRWLRDLPGRRRAAEILRADGKPFPSYCAWRACSGNVLVYTPIRDQLGLRRASGR